MAVDEHAAVMRRLRPGTAGEFRAHLGAQRRIERVERQRAAVEAEHDPAIAGVDAGDRSIFRRDTPAPEVFSLRLRECMGPIGRDERHLRRIAPHELRLAEGMPARAEKPHAAVRHFEAVAHRAIAQKSRGHRLVMKPAGHIGPQVANTRGEQHLGRAQFRVQACRCGIPALSATTLSALRNDPYTE
jgi:hypothetical protein